MWHDLAYCKGRPHLCNTKPRLSLSKVNIRDSGHLQEGVDRALVNELLDPWGALSAAGPIKIDGHVLLLARKPIARSLAAFARRASIPAEGDSLARCKWGRQRRRCAREPVFAQYPHAGVPAVQLTPEHAIRCADIGALPTPAVGARGREMGAGRDRPRTYVSS